MKLDTTDTWCEMDINFQWDADPTKSADENRKLFEKELETKLINSDIGLIRGYTIKRGSIQVKQWKWGD